MQQARKWVVIRSLIFYASVGRQEQREDLLVDGGHEHIGSTTLWQTTIP